MSDIQTLARGGASIKEFAAYYFERLAEVLGSLDLDELAELERELESARIEERTVFIAGNGGSATTATSMANDLGFDVLKKTATDRTFRIHALTDNVAALTAIANDVGYERVFVDQMRIHFRPGDVLIVVSASGNSSNVVLAAEWAKTQGSTIIAFLGFSGGRLMELADIKIHFKTEQGEYGPVEDAHLIVNHILAHWFQNKIGSKDLGS